MKYAMLPLLALAMGSLTPIAAQAAHAGAPYHAVNRANDKGNTTGDSEVDRLNSMQLDENYKGPTYTPGQTPPAAVPMAPPVDQTPATPTGTHARSRTRTHSAAHKASTAPKAPAAQ